MRDIHAREEMKKTRIEAGLLRKNEGSEHGILKSRCLGREKKEIEAVDVNRGRRKGGDVESGCFNGVFYDKD